MPQLTFPITEAGLALSVWVGLDSSRTIDDIAAKNPVPSPKRARGLLDTGCNMTAVTSTLLQQLGVISAGSGRTQTAAGERPVEVYDVSLLISDPAQPAGPWLVQSRLRVMELPTALPDVDVLIGLDLLRQHKLLLDGPAGQFTLEFEP